MRKEESRVNQIELPLWSGFRQVRLAELDVRQLLDVRFTSSQFQFYFIEIDPDNPALWTGNPCKFKSDIASTATSVHTNHSGASTCASQQIERRGVHDAG